MSQKILHEPKKWNATEEDKKSQQDDLSSDDDDLFDDLDELDHPIFCDDELLLRVDDQKVVNKNNAVNNSNKRESAGEESLTMVDSAAATKNLKELSPSNAADDESEEESSNDYDSDSEELLHNASYLPSFFAATNKWDSTHDSNAIVFTSSDEKKIEQAFITVDHGDGSATRRKLLQKAIKPKNKSCWEKNTKNPARKTARKRGDH